MSSESEHINQYNHNSDFYNAITTNRFPDWAIIVTYYKGIHLIESIMARSGDHPQSHQERKACMSAKSDVFSKDLRKDYRCLEGLSRKARYMPQYIISDEDVQMATEYFDTIRSWYNLQSKKK